MIDKYWDSPTVTEIDREVNGVRMSYFKRCFRSDADVAEELGVSVSAVQQRVRRCRARIRE